MKKKSRPSKILHAWKWRPKCDEKMLRSEKLLKIAILTQLGSSPVIPLFFGRRGTLSGRNDPLVYGLSEGTIFEEPVILIGGILTLCFLVVIFYSFFDRTYSFKCRKCKHKETVRAKPFGFWKLLFIIVFVGGAALAMVGLGVLTISVFMQQ